MTSKLRVWITRSEPGASRIAAVLKNAGHEPVVAPVVVIEAVDPDGVPGAPTDAIFLSEHAVEPGLAALLRSGMDPQALRVFAVGPHTAQRLRSAGVNAAVPAQASSEGLLAMPELANGAGREALILCGEGGRDLLHRSLATRGARVHRLALYRRRPAGVGDSPPLQPEGIDVISISSGDGFRWAAKVWFAAGGSPDVPVLVPSRRVADMGPALGFARVIACAGAGGDALLDALAELVG